MPWTAADATRHTKKADTPVKQRLWSSVANRVLRETKDEGRAIREAYRAILRHVMRGKR